MEIAKMEEKFEKMFRVFDRMVIEHVAGISLNYEENTLYQQSPCYQTVLTFQI